MEINLTPTQQETLNKLGGTDYLSRLLDWYKEKEALGLSESVTPYKEATVKKEAPKASPTRVDPKNPDTWYSKQAYTWDGATKTDELYYEGVEDDPHTELPLERRGYQINHRNRSIPRPLWAVTKGNVPSHLLNPEECHPQFQLEYAQLNGKTLSELSLTE